MELYKTTDRALVIMLLAFDCAWVKKERNEKGRFVFYFEKTETVIGLVKMWQCGEQIPVTDIRKVFVAESTFNAAIHDGI